MKPRELGGVKVMSRVKYTSSEDMWCHSSIPPETHRKVMAVDNITSREKSIDAWQLCVFCNIEESNVRPS